MGYARSAKVGFRVVSENMDAIDRANDKMDRLIRSSREANNQLSHFGDRMSVQGLTKFEDKYDSLISKSKKMSDSLISDTDKINDRLKGLADSSREYAGQIGKAFSDTSKEARNSFKRLPKEANFKVKTNLKQTSSDIDHANTRVQRFGTKGKSSFDNLSRSGRKTTKSFRNLYDAGNDFVNISSQIAMGAGMVGAAFLKSANEATNLQNKYITIKNLLKTGGESTSQSKRETAAMQKENNRFALQYGVSPTAMARGGEELVRRGYNGSQELASHKYFLQAARASGDPYNAVVNYGAPTLEQFGYKTKAGNSRRKMAAYTKKVLNEMAYGSDLTATNFEGMGNALRYVGATAHSSNQGLARTVASVGVLSNNGQDGSIAGTGLRKVMNSFAAPNMAAKSRQGQVMSALGLKPSDFQKANGQVKTLADNMDVLKKATAGMSSTDKFNVFHMFFGTTGQESGLILANNTKQLRSLTGQVSRAQKYGKNGYIATLAKKNMASWKNQIDVFKQHLNIMGLDFTKTVLPGITQALKIGNKILGDLIAMPKPLKTVAGYATAIAAAAGTAYVSYKMLGKSAEMLSSKHGSGGMQMANAEANVPMLMSGGKSARSSVKDWDVKGLTRTKLFGTATKEAAVNELPEIGSRMANRGTLSKALTGVKAVGSKVPWLDVALSSTALLGMNRHNAGSKIGNFGGTLAGMEGGAALGSFLGPAGTFIGGSLGAAAGSWLGSKAGKHIQSSFSSRSSQTENSVRKTNKQAYNPLSSLPKDAQLTTKKALGYVEQANKGWIKTNYDTWSKSKHLSADYQSQNLIYDKLGKNLDRFVNRQQSSSNKSISYLQKIGAIHATTAQKSYNEEAHWGNSRKQVINHDLQAIKTDEQNGGRNRAALVARLNSDIVKITSKGSNKQRQIYQKLKNSTSNLSYGQYRSVLKYSNRAERATLASARKSYNGQVSTAEATYRHTLKSAKQVYGVHSSEYRSVKKFAQRQYDKATTAAEKQYEGTKHWAEQQRKKVVNQAKLQATEVANSLLTATGKLGGQLGRILSENALAGIVTPSTKQKKNGLTNTIARNNRGNRNAKTANEATLPGLPTYSPGAITNSRHLTAADRKVQRRANSVGIQTLPGHALGGKINRAQTALVGEGGTELAYTVNGRQARLLGTNGPEIAHVKHGERILNHRDTKKVLSGSYGSVLPGYVTGNTKLGSSNSLKSVEKLSKKTVKDYKNLSNGSSKQLDKFSKSSKSKWSNIHKATSKITDSTQKKTVTDYDQLQKGSYKQLVQFDKGNTSKWRNINSDTKQYTNQSKNQAISTYDSMQKGVQKQVNQMQSGVISSGKATATGFGHALGKMDNYAHSAMSNTVHQLNGGIKGIDKVLGQFGGNSSVINAIHYAKGSNGELSNDQLAIVNDAKSGPRQESIIRNNSLLIPHGNDRMIPLKKRDRVLNGSQTQKLGRSLGIQHFAKGSGVSHAELDKIISKNNAHPNRAFTNEFSSNISKSNTVLGNAIKGLSKRSTTKYGNPWSAEVWRQMDNARGNGGGGAYGSGTWLHSPGSGFHDTSGMGYRGAVSGGLSIHDGNDFSGAHVIHAVHPGKVIRSGGAPRGWGGPIGIGQNMVTKSADGYYVIYQEFNGKNNSGAHTFASVGDDVKAGQRIAALGPAGTHVHIGVSKRNPFSNNPDSTSGWFDVTKMKSTKAKKSSKQSKKASSALSKLVSREIAPQLKWVKKHLRSSNVGSLGLSGGTASRAKTLYDAIKEAYPSSTKAGIEAVVGNWLLESGLNPGIQNSIGASGLGQWYKGRFTALKAYAKKHGTSWKNAGTQIGFALNGDSSNSSILKSVLRGKGSVASLATKFSSEWEQGGYTGEHVADAVKVAALLHNNGGWSTKNRLNVYGEKDPEVAINPKKRNADSLIGSAIDARSKVSNSVFSNESQKKVHKALLENLRKYNPLKGLASHSKPAANANNNVTVNLNMNITVNANDKNAGTKVANDISKQVNEQVQAIFGNLMAKREGGFI